MADRTIRIIQAVVAAIAVLFGARTVFAGGRVLLGADPGYEVFRPLLHADWSEFYGSTTQ